MNDQNIHEAGAVSAGEALTLKSPEVSTKSSTIPYRANLLGNIEQALKGLQGYGIMALELIQNADDAGAKTLSFDARDDALVVANEGTFSSCGFEEAECPWLKSGDPSGVKRPCNFHAIAEMGSRSKQNAAEQIGRFGIGFVSVYQITDTPTVRSSGLEIRLNPQTQEVSKSEIASVAGTQFILPWAAVESDVRAGLNASPTPVDVADKVIAEIDQVLQGSLLFLRHVERVELRRNGKPVMDVEIDRSGGELMIQFNPSGIIQQWLILTREADDIIESSNLLDRFDALARLDRSKTVSVAVPINVEQVDGLLYAYLPTRQSIRMPVHVNGDFFPHASRQAIVLEGEQHDRYWNEALIETAAAVLADNFVAIRDLLGPARFWALLEAAFHRKGEPSFKAFWDRLSKAAIALPSIWTTQGKWRLAGETSLPPEAMTAAGQKAIADLGLALIHGDLRRHWSVISSIGAQQLRLSSVVTALEVLEESELADGIDSRLPLWAAIELLIDASLDRAGLPAVLAKLQEVPLMLDIDGQPIRPVDARRLPASVAVADLKHTLPERRVVHPQILKLSHLTALVAEFLLDDLAADLAVIIADGASAAAAIGETDDDVRRFYALLTSFPTDRKTGAVAGILANVPMLKTGAGFVSPSRGQLPGDFRDPVGHFEIVDTRLFVPGMMDLASNILDVNVLTFRRYVDDHLEEILKGELTRQQYRQLMTEIMNHRSQLEEDGTLKSLSDIACIRNRAGEFARPKDVYFWSASLESILGDEPARWVADDWMPADRGRVRDLLDRMEMPSTVAAEHIVQRIDDMSAAGDLDSIVAGTTPIIRHVLEQWSRYDDDDRAALGRLSEVSFLSAIVDGKRDEKLRYSPGLLYRAGRAVGFASQAPVVEMTALRQSTTVVNEFLDLVGMPLEPPTELIVAHLEHCMDAGLPVSDLTYQILSERLEAGDAACIDRLEGTNFIYVPDAGFIGAGEVFWIPPDFGRYWHAPSLKMRQREPLYRRLGVVDSPEPRHFAALAVQIAGRDTLSPADIDIHGRCISTLAEALEREDAGAAEAVDLLKDENAFLNIEGVAIWPGHAVWLDSDQLAEAFGSVLNERLVRLSDVSRAAAVRMLKRLDVLALTDVARFRLAEEPDGNPNAEATSMLQDRADLVLWLAPNRATRQALRDLLLELEIQFSRQILVQAEIDAFDPPVRSPSSPVPAYLDRETGLLHLRTATGKVDWAAAFRALFAEVERHCPTTDIRPLCLTAKLIMSLPDREEAELELLESGFKASSNDDQPVEAGRELEDETDSPELEEPATDLPGADFPDAATGAEMEEFGCADIETMHSESGPKVSPTVEDDNFVQASDADDQVDPEQPSDEAEEEAEDYGSARNHMQFGEEPADSASPGPIEAIAGGKGTGSSGIFQGSQTPSSAGERNAAAAADRQVRRSRMLSYVSRSGTRGNGDSTTSSDGNDITDLIDAAAMKAAMNFEQVQGRTPERQPHFNPGFDIVSKSPGGITRLIEVKGLEDEWTERGIKLSHVQFSMARENPGEFWIYIVEHARDLERQKVTAIANPFSKVEEYWFDHNWRELSEEQASSRDILLKVGLKVEHHFWKKGVIVEIKTRGAIPFVVVDFGSIEGRRGLPFNSTLKIVE